MAPAMIRLGDAERALVGGVINANIASNVSDAVRFLMWQGAARTGLADVTPVTIGGDENE